MLTTAPPSALLLMSSIRQVLINIWVTIVILSKKKRTDMSDVDEQPSFCSPREALQDTCNRRPSQKAAKSRTRSAKYLLRQGSIHVENWNCDLSEMYSRKSPRSLSPSPLLPGSSETFRSPDLPAYMPSGFAAPPSCHSLRSPFLSSASVQQLEKSPILAVADVSDIVMQDFQPIAYSNHPSSAVASCTLWDVPATLSPIILPGSSTLSQAGDRLFVCDAMYIMSPRHTSPYFDDGREGLSIGSAVSPL